VLLGEVSVTTGHHEHLPRAMAEITRYGSDTDCAITTPSSVKRSVMHLCMVSGDTVHADLDRVDTAESHGQCSPLRSPGAKLETGCYGIAETPKEGSDKYFSPLSDRLIRPGTSYSGMLESSETRRMSG
jgi:hypothetical protein